MLNDRILLFYDLETLGGTDPKKSVPYQICAKAINPVSLAPIEGGEFHSWIKQGNITQDDIQWHTKARGMTEAVFVGKIQESPSEEQVWKDFANFTKRFHKPTKRQSIFSAAIRCGMNIIRL